MKTLIFKLQFGTIQEVRTFYSFKIAHIFLQNKMTTKNYSLEDQQLENEYHTPKSGFDKLNDQENTIDTQKAFKINSKYSIYEQAIHQLQEFSVPSIIPCRENEKETILRFITNGADRKGCAETLYISGVPGIGKTICVKHAIQLFKQRNKKRSGDFIDIYINAMNLLRPQNLYASMLKQLTNLDVASCKVLPILNQVLTKGTFPQSLHAKTSTLQIKQINKRLTKTKIIFIDEVDYLLTRDEDIVYNLFDWTQSSNSKIVLITTSNTIDFPERLQQKILSRIGNQRLVFSPYTSDSIQKILQARMKQLNVFQKQGIRLISMKIAKTSSDIRRSLFILRQSIIKFMNMKKAGQTDQSLISMSIITSVYQDLYKDPFLKSLKFLPRIQRTVLSLLVELIKQNGKYCWLSELLVLIRIKKESKLSKSILVEQTLTRLKELNIVKMSTQDRHKDKRVITTRVIPNHVSEFQIQLNIPIDSILTAIED